MTRTTLFHLLPLMLVGTGAAFEEQGQRRCTCAPRQIDFELDFSKTCESTVVKNSRGSRPSVLESFCSIVSYNGQKISDLVPVKATSIQIFELNSELGVIKQEVEENPEILNGDSIRFKSSLSDHSTIGDVPGGFQMRISAENAAGQEIVMDWIVQYTNECTIEPFTVGDSIGWTVIRHIKAPTTDLCYSEPDFFSIQDSIDADKEFKARQLSEFSLSMSMPQNAKEESKLKQLLKDEVVSVPATSAPTMSPITSPSISPTSIPTMTPIYTLTMSPTKKHTNFTQKELELIDEMNVETVEDQEDKVSEVTPLSDGRSGTESVGEIAQTAKATLGLGGTMGIVAAAVVAGVGMTVMGYRFLISSDIAGHERSVPQEF